MIIACFVARHAFDAACLYVSGSLGLLVGFSIPFLISH